LESSTFKVKGSTFKRCACTELVHDDSGQPVTGSSGKPKRRQLGAKCPKLRRADGSWNPRHGTWYLAVNLPVLPGKKRAQLKRGGYSNQNDAEAALDHVKNLFAILDTDDHAGLADLVALLLERTKNRAPLPDVDEVRRRYTSGQQLSRAMTTGEWLDHWLATRVDLRKGTARGYEGHIRNHLRLHLGHIPIGKLRVGHVNDMYRAIAAENERIIEARQAADPAVRATVKGKRTVAPATMHRINATLSSALEDAREEIGLELNVARFAKTASAKKPKPLVWTDARVQAWDKGYQRRRAEARARAGRRPINVFRIWRDPQFRPSRVMVYTPQQTGVFLDRAVRHRLYALYHLVAFRGLRRGEACGVRWEDFDLDDAGTLTISNTLIQLGWEVEEEDPKTEASDATIALDSVTIAVLKAHHERQRQAEQEWGQAWVDSGYAFTREDGSPLHPAHVTDQFERLAFEAGLPPTRLHDLRHGAATLHLKAGAEMKIVQAMLRHASITTTSDIYTSVLPEVAREAAEAAAALVPRTADMSSGGTGVPISFSHPPVKQTGRSSTTKNAQVEATTQVRRQGLEPRTRRLRVRCSAIRSVISMSAYVSSSATSLVWLPGCAAV